MGLEVYDNFKVQRNVAIGGEDLFVLSQLYLPLIGMDSFSVYFILATLKEDTYQIKKIVDILNLANTSYLNIALDKLQGLGLLNVLYNETKSTHIFQVNAPLNMESFYANNILSGFLKTQIGEIEFEQIKNQKSKSKNPQYKDITKTFSETFKVKEVDFVNMFNPSFKNKIKDNIIISNPNFDYALFKLSFNTDFFDEGIFDDEVFKKEIIKISFNYSLNEEEMKEAVMKTIDIDKDIKFKDIAKNARTIYNRKKKKPSETTKFVTKQPDLYTGSDLDDDKLQLLDYLEKHGISSVLESLSGMKASASELEMLEKLTETSGFSQGVINVMIVYVNAEKDGVFPGYNYFEKIASTWKRAGIKTAKDALEYINRPREKTIRKKVKDAPKWVDEYANKRNENIQNSLSDEEKKKVLIEAQNLFKDKK